MRTAVPEYVGNHFEDCPPGHRFSLYFPIWKNDWQIEKEQKGKAVKETLPLPTHTQNILAALRERQAILLDSYPSNAYFTIEADSTAPLATGLGIEHPLENGFAFLNPYGVAYLPGSSIKGVLRRAAEELADESTLSDRAGWHSGAITELFGLESEDHQKDHTRGTLTFWDAFPKPANNRMGMEIITPHYGSYYRGESAPHDSGQPNPIVFLVVPAESEFSFHLTCNAGYLSDALRATWQDLMRAAFIHAFDWLGFGAKTAVGYGAMKRNEKREMESVEKKKELERRVFQEAEAKRLEKEKIDALEKLTPVERSIQEFLDNRKDKSASEISAVIGWVKQGGCKEDERVAIAEWLKNKMQGTKGQWKETNQAKNPNKNTEYKNTLLVMEWLRK